MTTITTAERDTYRDVWQHIPQYGEVSPGERLAPVFDDLVSGLGHQRGTVLDAGCGSGKGALALKALGYTVTLCDLTDAGLVDEAREFPFFEAALWRDLRPHLKARWPNVDPFKMHEWTRFDWVYCTDVLEHLPTAMVGLVVSRLLEVARYGVFISVSLELDINGVWIGKLLHQTVQPFTWWRDLLAELGRVIEARDCIGSAIFLVVPR